MPEPSVSALPIADPAFSLRHFRGAADYPGLTAVINATVAEDGEGEYLDVDAIAAVYDHLQRCDPDTDIVIADGPDGGVVGYARVVWEDVPAEGHRAYWIAFEALSTVTGLAEALVHWGLTRASAVAAGHDHPNKRIQCWAIEGGHRAAAIEAIGGFEPFAWSAWMVRQLGDDIADVALPAGLELRPVEASQLRAIWDADVDAFRDAHGFVEPTENDYAMFLDEAAKGTDLWQIAWDDRGVAGQVRTYVNAGEAARRGRRRAWTESISTRKDWRGRGVASAVITSSLRQLAGQGYDEAALGVDLGNPTGALGVYERLGYEVVLRQAQYARQPLHSPYGVTAPR